jgi:hypothetical protein
VLQSDNKNRRIFPDAASGSVENATRAHAWANQLRDCAPEPGGAAAKSNAQSKRPRRLRAAASFIRSETA